MYINRHTTTNKAEQINTLYYELWLRTHSHTHTQNNVQYNQCWKQLDSSADRCAGMNLE